MTTRWARLSLVAFGGFAVALLALHALEPEFDPTWRFLSEYELGAFGWLMHTAFILLAFSLVSIGVAVFPDVKNLPGIIGLIVLAVGAIGLSLAGIFRTDSITTPVGSLSPSGQMHVFGASLDYTPVATLLVSLSLLRLPEWKRLRLPLFAASGVTLILMVAFILSMPPDGHFGPGTWTGLVGRIALLSYGLWISVVAVGVMRRA